MSRSGYSDDCDENELNLWRGAVQSAIRGKRGQAFLREMLAALEAMSRQRLIANELQEADGEVCALGAVGLKRGMDMATIDPEDRERVAREFGIAEALAAEIMNENDEAWCSTPEERWQRMRDWVQSQIRVA